MERICRLTSQTLLCTALVFGAVSPVEVSAAAAERHSSENLRGSIRRGLNFLLKTQNPGGWWSSKDHPAVTGLALTAFMQEPDAKQRSEWSSELNRGFDFVLESAQADGSIHRGSLKNYNTSLCLVALAASGNAQYQPVIDRARTFLVGSQIDMGQRGRVDSPFDGGVGYGSKYQHSDLNNTVVALEALRKSESLERRPKGQESADLNWAAALNFLQACQNLPSQNQAEWVSNSPADRGGFVYYPGNSMAGSTTDPVTGRTALRSYGSMSYAGLLSFAYARLGADDPRVAAVIEWLGRNYTLDENPGMGAQGYYYYLHLMAKALTAAGVETLTLADGTRVAWREQVTQKLLLLQRPDGSWLNHESRWWEADATIVTAYVVLTLQEMEAARLARIPGSRS